MCSNYEAMYKKANKQNKLIHDKDWQTVHFSAIHLIRRNKNAVHK